MENPITLEEERKVWTIHQSVNGITYYYNRSTKKSQYEMPECFKTTEEDLDHPDWKEYRTAEGKKFYYNALTRRSCWHMPVEVKEWKMKIDDQKRLERENNLNLEEEPLSEVEELKRKFMGLLKSKGVNANTKWDSCIQLCEDDDRWNLLKVSEKKKYFLEYIAELKKGIEILQKAKTEANKIQFIKMLRENKTLTSDCKMHKIQFDFITDPRWRILEGADKENAFQDYMDELYTKEKEEARITKERNIDTLRALLLENDVKYYMKWDEFRSKFRNYDCYKKLHELDRITTFTKYIVEAEELHQANEVKEKKMKERTNRDNFRNLLKEKLFKGDITYKTKWRTFLKEFREEKLDRRVINMMDPEYRGTSAHEIFENLMEMIKKNHKVFKSEIKSHFKKINFKMTEETTLDNFYEKLSDLPLYAQAKPLLRESFYHYFQQKIRAKNAAKVEKEKEKEREKAALHKKAEKKEKRALFKIFKQYTESNSKVRNDVDKIQESLKQQENLNISKESIFRYYLEYLEAPDDDKKSRYSHSPSERAKSKSRSSSSSRSKEERKKKKRRDEDRSRDREIEREREREKFQERESNKKESEKSMIKSIAIPNELKPSKNNEDMEEEGEIKDDE